MAEVTNFRSLRGFKCERYGRKLWVGQSSDLVGLPDDAEAPGPLHTLVKVPYIQTLNNCFLCLNRRFMLQT